MSELGDCPFCGSVDVDGVNRNGLMYFDCYGCGARVHFLLGLSVDDQKGRFQRRAKVAELEAAMREIYEVHAGSDGFISETAAEGYQQRLIEQMVEIAAQHLPTPPTEDKSDG